MPALNDSPDSWEGYAHDLPSGFWPEAKYGPELDLRRLLWCRGTIAIKDL